MTTVRPALLDATTLTHCFVLQFILRRLIVWLLDSSRTRLTCKFGSQHEHVNIQECVREMQRTMLLLLLPC
jgi:hypothetical protein